MDLLIKIHTDTSINYKSKFMVRSKRGGGNGDFWGFLGIFGDGDRVIFYFIPKNPQKSPKIPIIDTVFDTKNRLKHLILV